MQSHKNPPLNYCQIDELEMFFSSRYIPSYLSVETGENQLTLRTKLHDKTFSIALKLQIENSELNFQVVKHTFIINTNVDFLQ